MTCHYNNKELNQVLFEGDSYFRKVILNRAAKLNCLNYEMISQMLKNFRAFETDSSIKFIILKGYGKAFCAGGDLLSVGNSVMTGHWSFGARFYKKLLYLDHLIATYRKPLLPLIDGIVMGAGAGLSLHGRFKIVTEKTVFAMPEAFIGHFPDVGASHFLSRLPGYFGEYLGLTGARLDGTEMIACGLATHFVFSKDLPLLEDALVEVASSDVGKIQEILNKFSQKRKIKQDSIYNRLEIINTCFSEDTVEEILTALEGEAKRKLESWTVAAINSIRSASPISLKITIRSIREGRMQSLKQCFIREYVICCNVLRATVSNDVFEGSRSTLLHNGKRPKWVPSKLELVGKEMVDRCFSNIEDDDWKCLRLPSRSTTPTQFLKSSL